MERPRRRQLLVELPRPVAFEIDRVNEVHQRIAGQRIGDDLVNQSMRLLVDPRVDGRRGRRGGEIERIDPRVEVGAIRVQERLLDRESQPVPDRIRDLKLHVRIEPAEQGD